MPIGIITVLSGIAILVQSCSLPTITRPEGQFVNLEALYAPFIVYGFILLVGTGFSVFTFVQVNKISRKLKELGHSI